MQDAVDELRKLYESGLNAVEQPEAWSTTKQLLNALFAIQHLTQRPDIRGRTIKIRQECQIEPRDGWPCFQHWATAVITAAVQTREGTAEEQTTAHEYLQQQADSLPYLKNGLWEELDRIGGEPPKHSRPLTMPSLIELVVGRSNRVGTTIAKRSSTVYSWRDRRSTNGFPDPLTWQSARAWLLEKHDFDIGDEPPEG